MVLGRTLLYDPELTLCLGSSYLAVWCLQADHLTFWRLVLSSHKIRIEIHPMWSCQSIMENDMFETALKLQGILTYTLFLLQKLVAKLQNLILVSIKINGVLVFDSATPLPELHTV